MNTVQRLEEIRRLQGLSPMPDPGVIQGPIPHFDPPTVTDQDSFEDFPGDDPAYPDPHKSPLVAAALPKPEGVAAALFDRPGPIVPANSDLLVYDSRATLQGYSVTLSDQDLAQIKRIVLGALQRDVRSHLESLPQPEPKRRRRAKAAVSEPVSAAPKKRGRPKKNP